MSQCNHVSATAELRGWVCDTCGAATPYDAIAAPQGTTMSVGANSRQVGGDHYKTPIEPWDFVAANNLGYFEGSVIKYITRWRKKGGMQDLEKAKHYLEKLMEIERAANP